VDNAGLRQNIQIDRAKAARLGITVGAIDGALYGAFGQRQISTIYSDINQYSVVVNALPSQTATPAALDEVYVRARNGDMVPITAVANRCRAWRRRRSPMRTSTRRWTSATTWLRT
jgi:multidrug efflux pump